LEGRQGGDSGAVDKAQLSQVAATPGRFEGRDFAAVVEAQLFQLWRLGQRTQSTSTSHLTLVRVRSRSWVRPASASTPRASALMGWRSRRVRAVRAARQLQFSSPLDRSTCSSQGFQGSQVGPNLRGNAFGELEALKRRARQDRGDVRQVKAGSGP
jgi:hypothetical protein